MVSNQPHDNVTLEASTPTTAAVRLRAMLLVAILLVGVFGAVVSLTGVVGAQSNTATESIDEKAPYYSENTSQVNNESWLAGHENASLDAFVTMLTRVGTFVVGEPPESNGPGGAIVVGLIVAGTIGSTFVRQGPGPVGGAVLGLVGLAGVTAVGLAPVWLMTVSLFVLGLILTSVIIRVLR
jgi:hypothetical protein